MCEFESHSVDKMSGSKSINRFTLTCTKCSKVIQRVASDLPKSGSVFCSPSCSAKYNNRNREVPVKKIFKCACGVEVPVKFSEPTCCKKCLVKNRTRPNVSICIKCKESFLSTSRPGRRKYCDKCLNILRSDNGREQGKKQNTNRRSKNEILFAELCKSVFECVLENPKIFNGWDADVVIEDLKVAILWNGKWHYEKLRKNHHIKMVQNRDSIKQREIEKTGYTCYIIKDEGRHNEEFVKNEFNKFIQSIQYTV